jgi:alkylation response protein AidB-like acyl-CoA dehydrogenase
MDFELSPDEQAFREEVRTFIKSNLPPAKQRGADFLANWLKKVRDKRWVGLSWPKDAGGGDGSLIEQAILREEMALAKAPPLGTSFMGLAWVGPCIIQYGTPAQRQRFIPTSSIRKSAGDAVPTELQRPRIDSASRSAASLCRQRPKIWTTVRRGPTGSSCSYGRICPEGQTRRHHVLLVDMKTPGIDVRPIENMASDKHFAEVFFTDVKVPVENRLETKARLGSDGFRARQ